MVLLWRYSVMFLSWIVGTTRSWKKKKPFHSRWFCIQKKIIKKLMINLWIEVFLFLISITRCTKFHVAIGAFQLLSWRNLTISISSNHICANEEKKNRSRASENCRLSHNYSKKTRIVSIKNFSPSLSWWSGIFSIFSGILPLNSAIFSPILSFQPLFFVCRFGNS